MSKTTSKKSKKKKYTTRLEKNKRIYYKNDSSTYTDKKSNNNKLVLIILIISIFFNAFFLLKINNLSLSVDDLNNTIEDKNGEMERLEDDYTNYLFLGDSITDFYDLDKYYDPIRGMKCLYQAKLSVSKPEVTPRSSNAGGEQTPREAPAMPKFVRPDNLRSIGSGTLRSVDPNRYRRN